MVLLMNRVSVILRCRPGGSSDYLLRAHTPAFAQCAGALTGTYHAHTIPTFPGHRPVVNGEIGESARVRGQKPKVQQAATAWIRCFIYLG